MEKFVFFFLVLILSGCTTYSAIEPTPEMHFIGVYQGTAPDTDERPWHQKCSRSDSLSCFNEMRKRNHGKEGQVVVNVSITGKPIILAFTAYNRTTWIVKAEKGVVINKVILGGYHTQSVQGVADDTLIEVYTHDSSPCPKCYQGKGYFYSYKSVPAQLEKVAGTSASSWQGKYKGLEFSIFPEIKTGTSK